MGSKMEVRINGRWYAVSMYIWRSWTGRRRMNGREHHGAVFVLGTNRLTDSNQARECPCC